MGRRGPLRGVGIKLGVVLPPLGVVLPPLGVVLPPLGVGKRLRLPEERRLLVGSPYMLGDEADIERTPFNPLEPLGGREAVGFNFFALGVLVLSLGEDCVRVCAKA